MNKESHKKQIQRLMRTMENRKKIIGLERDKLRDIADEAQELEGKIDDVVDALERAIDALSETL